MGEADDKEFYKNWKTALDSYRNTIEEISTAKKINERNKENSRIFENFESEFYVTDNKNFKEIKSRINKSFDSEDKDFIIKSKDLTQHKIISRYNTERDNVDSLINKHSKWLATLKTQVFC